MAPCDLLWSTFTKWPGPHEFLGQRAGHLPYSLFALTFPVGMNGDRFAAAVDDEPTIYFRNAKQSCGNAFHSWTVLVSRPTRRFSKSPSGAQLPSGKPPYGGQ